MFKSQGLFSSVPCPSSPCTLQHCIFNHQPLVESTGQTALGSSAQVLIISPDRTSLSDGQRSHKRRIIEVSSATSSHDHTILQHGQAEVGQAPTALSSASASSSASSSAAANMLGILPRDTNHCGHGKDHVLTFNKSTTSTKVDTKRKYTETFNLAAQEFKPSKMISAGITVPPTPLQDTAVPASINNNVRRVPLDMIYKAYKELYSSLPGSVSLASRDAAKEELFIAKSSPNAQTYTVGWRQYYARLKKRDSVTSVTDACTMYELERRKLQAERAAKWNAPLTWNELSLLVHSPEELSRWGYITGYPPLKPYNPDELVACDRCTTVFTPKTRTQYPCISHWGKLNGSSKHGLAADFSDKTWTCCQANVGRRGCYHHPCHVRKVSNPGELMAIRPFIELEPFIEGTHLPVVSLDCEMAYTLNGMELVRLTVLDNSDRLVFDVLVRTEAEITDYNTRFSGITKEMLETQNTVSFEEAIELLKLYVSSTTIIMGHGLENDLVALRLIHLKVIDTALMYPHPRGRPYRLGLKDLVKRETGLDVQTAGADGHSSVEDAAAASLLIRKKARMSVFPGHGKVKVGGHDGGDGNHSTTL